MSTTMKRTRVRKARQLAAGRATPRPARRARDWPIYTVSQAELNREARAVIGRRLTAQESRHVVKRLVERYYETHHHFFEWFQEHARLIVQEELGTTRGAKRRPKH